MDWFLYDNGLRHERVNERLVVDRNVNIMTILWSDGTVISYYHLIYEQLLFRAEDSNLHMYPFTIKDSTTIHQYLLTFFRIFIRENPEKGL